MTRRLFIMCTTRHPVGRTFDRLVCEQHAVRSALNRLVSVASASRPGAVVVADGAVRRLFNPGKFARR